MSWLRIDDGFPEHPKLVSLGTPADRWTWLELLAYCARRETKGEIPEGIHDVLRRVTPKFLERCVKVGLADQDACGQLTVHDWNIYNGTTIRDQVFAFIDSNPEATANEVQRALRGNRQAILGLFAEYHGSKVVPTPVPPEPQERFQSRFLAPAPAPAPAPSQGSNATEAMPTQPNTPSYEATGLDRPDFAAALPPLPGRRA